MEYAKFRKGCLLNSSFANGFARSHSVDEPNARRSILRYCVWTDSGAAIRILPACSKIHPQNDLVDGVPARGRRDAVAIVEAALCIAVRRIEKHQAAHEARALMRLADDIPLDAAMAHFAVRRIAIRRRVLDERWGLDISVESVVAHLPKSYSRRPRTASILNGAKASL